MAGRKRHKVIVAALLMGTILAALKSIFVSLQMDEEYAISMPYRMLLGDKMFTEIWDPHQTSAFFMQFLIWLFMKLFHTTTGVVIWVRIWGTLVHAVIACRVCRMMRNYVNREYSFYLGILYFNLLPKGYIMPEFSNMLVWSTTLLLLSLHPTGKKRILPVGAEAGIWMCVMVLSYPSAILLFPFVVWWLWKNLENGKKQALIFGGVCLLAGAGYLLCLFRYVSPVELYENIRLMLQGNSGHTEVGALNRVWIYVKDVGYEILIAAGYGIATCLGMKLLQKGKKLKGQPYQLNKEEKVCQGMYLLLTLALFSQVVHWLAMLWEFEWSYLYGIYFILFGFSVYLGRKLDGEVKKLVKLWTVGNVLMFLAVLVLTDLTMFTSVRYVFPGIIVWIAALLIYSEKQANRVYKKWAGWLLLLWCFVAIFVKGWEYRDNEGRMKNITCVRGVISEGPAKGIITEYMQSYVQESMYGEMQQNVRQGDKLFILDMNSIGYMYRDVEVASYTTICDPRYNEALLAYYERNPEKYPDVVIVPCWFGELKWNPESWIMTWIEEEFPATQVVDGKYYRYYIR